MNKYILGYLSFLFSESRLELASSSLKIFQELFLWLSSHLTIFC